MRQPLFFAAKVTVVAIAFAALGALLWVVIGRFSQEDSVPNLPEPVDLVKEADSVLKDFKYTSTDAQGVVEWKLKAAKATHFEDQNLVTFENVTVTFFSRNDRIYHLSAASGTVDTEKQDFYLSGSVVGTTDDGIRFRTESLDYRAEEREVRTNDKVFLESPELDLEGQGMILDLEKEKVYVLRHVRALGKKQ